jgi:cysteine synthase A
MPNNQSKAKEELIKAFGAKLHLVDPCPFKDENHFYHRAKNMAKNDPEKYWWADQFENVSNQKAHYTKTGPEIWEQLPDISHFICTAGSGGSIGGISKYLKEQNNKIQCLLVDPKGSGLKSYMETGEFKSEGSSFTEGIGIMRLVNNFKEANLDGAMSLDDQCLVSVAHTLQKLDGIVLGLSSALNAAAALKLALSAPKGSKIVSLSCDLGERSFAKLYNEDFLSSKQISSGAISLPELSNLLDSSN